jgi:hypothetical protein
MFSSMAVILGIVAPVVLAVVVTRLIVSGAKGDSSAARKAELQELAAMRNELAALNGRIDELHQAVLRLDKRLSAPPLGLPSDAVKATPN